MSTILDALTADTRFSGAKGSAFTNLGSGDSAQNYSHLPSRNDQTGKAGHALSPSTRRHRIPVPGMPVRSGA